MLAIVAVASAAGRRPYQIVTVFGVVMELAAAGAGACPNVIEAHTGDALLCDEPGCGLHNPLTHRASFRVAGACAFSMTGS
jgi:hypothetical protein